MPEVTVAEDALIGQGETWYDPETGDVSGWEADPHFLVTALDGNHRALLPAVWAAYARFAAIDENGSSLDEWERNGETYTPNFIFDPVLLPVGLALHADTKGFLTAPMGAAMVRVLAEELASNGLDAHISALGDRVALETGEPAPVPETEQMGDGQPAEPAEMFWYMSRTLWTKTQTGRRYQDVEYRRVDGTWGRDRSAAQRWADDDRDEMVALAYALRAEEDAAYRTTYGEATGLLLPTDPTYDPWPMPPQELRASDPDFSD